MGKLTINSITGNMSITIGGVNVISLTYTAPTGIEWLSASGYNPTTLAIGDTFKIAFFYETGDFYPNLPNIETTYRSLLGVSDFTFKAEYLSRAADDEQLLITISGTVGSTATGGNFNLSASGMLYTITENLVGCSMVVDSDFLNTYSEPTAVLYAPLPVFIVTANTGYNLPDTITVTGATFTWNPNS